jgi:hypothetical protein
MSSQTSESGHWPGNLPLNLALGSKNVSLRVEPEGAPQEPTVRSPHLGLARTCAGGNGVKMPLLRYFMYVGGALLTLLLISNAVLPQVPLPGTLTSGSDLPTVRIHSERKLPDKVVFDTSVPVRTSAPVAVVAAAPVPAVVAAPPAVAEMSAKARVREAFAQLPDVTLPEPKMVSKVPVPKRKIAKPRTLNSLVMVAQQPHFGQNTW